VRVHKGKSTHVCTSDASPWEKPALIWVNPARFLENPAPFPENPAPHHSPFFVIFCPLSYKLRFVGAGNSIRFLFFALKHTRNRFFAIGFPAPAVRKVQQQRLTAPHKSRYCFQSPFDFRQRVKHNKWLTALDRRMQQTVFALGYETPDFFHCHGSVSRACFEHDDRWRQEGRSLAIIRYYHTCGYAWRGAALERRW
jgi:hypothetical protein